MLHYVAALLSVNIRGSSSRYEDGYLFHLMRRSLTEGEHSSFWTVSLGLQTGISLKLNAAVARAGGFWEMWYLAEALCLVHARAVDEQRVEEDCVALFHLHVHPGLLRVVVSHAMVHLVHPALRTHAVL